MTAIAHGIRFARRWGGSLALLAALAAGPGSAGAAAGSDAANSALCARAADEAGRLKRLPPGLLAAIATVESGRPIEPAGEIRPWPWALNADGIDLFFASRAEAVAWAEHGLASGVRQMDVGCMQINLQSHPGAFRTLDEAFDPAANAAYAAGFLRQLATEANGDWNYAVGLYHSRTPVLAAAYRDRFAELGAGIISGIGGPEPLYFRALRRGSLRLPLKGGGTLLVNTHRQPSARAPRRSSCDVARLLAPLLNGPPRVAGCQVASH